MHPEGRHPLAFLTPFTTHAANHHPHPSAHQPFPCCSLRPEARAMTREEYRLFFPPLFLLPHVSIIGSASKDFESRYLYCNFLYLLGRNDRSGVSVLGREIPPSPTFYVLFPLGFVVVSPNGTAYDFYSNL